MSAATADPDPITLLESVTKTFASGRSQVRALGGVDLRIQRGEFVAIMGPSGSGKTTLMEILGCLSRPTSGVHRFRGRDVARLDDRKLAWLRGEEIGFVFQSFHLLPRLSALENVELPLVYRGVGRAERRRRALEVLAHVGLAERAVHRPGELSGGERQRVAIARALVNHPSLLLADEPTGNLDTRTGEEILALLEDLHRRGNSIVIVTHDASIGSRAERLLTIRDGTIQGDERRAGAR